MGAGIDVDSGETELACVDDLAALAFVEGTCSAARRSQILEHLDTCTACQELIAGVVDLAEQATAPMSSGPQSEPPEMFGPYRLGPMIAQGGMGRIYRAYDTTLKRDVALKVPRSGIPALARRFEREAAITARLQHPGIVPIHGAGQTPDGTPFYVMRFIEGRTLDALIAEATTLEARLALVDRVISVADTMGYVHAQRIVHRDLKPNNVLVGQFGETLLIDWGLAKQLTDSRASLPVIGLGTEPSDTPATLATLRTRAGDVLGTPAFMAPEQAAGEPVDARADVYALGAMLRTVLNGDLRPRPDGAIDGPPALVAVCRRALELDPGARHANGDELAASLRGAVEPAKAKPVARSRTKLVPILAIALLVIATGVTLVATRRSPARQVTRKVVTRQPPDTLVIALSPSGTRVAYGSHDRFEIRDLATGRTWSRAELPMWPWLIEFESDDVVRYSVRGSGETSQRKQWSLTTDTAEPSGAPTPLSDGYWIGTYRGGDLFVPSKDERSLELLGSGQRTQLPSETTRPIRIFTIAPGRQRLAFVEDTAGGGRIRIVDGPRTLVSPTINDISALTWFDDETIGYTVGSRSGSTLYRAVATEQGLARPAKLYTTEEGGWLGALTSRRGRVLASWVSATSESRLHTLATNADVPLDKVSASAPLGWLDDTTFVTFNNATRQLERHSPLPGTLPAVTQARLPDDPINVTRADELVIITVRGSREIVATSIGEATPKWTKPAGVLAFVRCAGDRAPPCVAGRLTPSGAVEIVRIDPASGALGELVVEEGPFTDAAIDATSAHLAWVVDARSIFVRPLDRSTPAREVPPERAGIQSVAFDSDGHLLASNANPEGRQIVRYRDGVTTPIVTGGFTVLSLIRQSPDGQRILYRVRTLAADLVEIHLP